MYIEHPDYPNRKIIYHGGLCKGHQSFHYSILYLNGGRSHSVQICKSLLKQYYMCDIFQPFGEATLGKFGLVIIPLLVAVALFGSLMGTVFTGTRITFSAARDGFLPDFLCGIHREFNTPLPATITLVSIYNASDVLCKQAPSLGGGIFAGR